MYVRERTPGGFNLHGNLKKTVLVLHRVAHRRQKQTTRAIALAPHRHCICFTRTRNPSNRCRPQQQQQQQQKLYYIRFDGTGVCVEECPTATDFDRLWACTDDNSAFTVGEGYDCADGNEATCAEKADVQPTGGDEGTFGGGDGEGFCMYQVESVDCEWLSPVSRGLVLEYFLTPSSGGADAHNNAFFMDCGRLSERSLFVRQVPKPLLRFFLVHGVLPGGPSPLAHPVRPALRFASHSSIRCLIAAGRFSQSMISSALYFSFLPLWVSDRCRGQSLAAACSANRTCWTSSSTSAGTWPICRRPPRTSTPRGAGFLASGSASPP